MQTDSALLIDGRYEISELKGEQGGVELYDAYDTLLDRPVSLQIMSTSGAEDPHASRLFLRHQQIASSIHNCPLLAVYDAGTWNGRPFSVMERDKGSRPETIHTPGQPTDLSAAVSLTRQVAEALKCCREAGLSDWSFSPEAVRIKDGSEACLAIIEGYDGSFSSSSPSMDAPALAALLSIFLTGKPEPGVTGLRSSLVPSWFVSRVASLDPRLGGSAVTAADFAGELESIEEASDSPTEPYTPPPENADERPAGEAATAPVATLAAFAEAPTLPAELQAADPVKNTRPLPVAGAEESPYTPPAKDILPEEQPGKKRVNPALLGLVGLLLLGVLAAVIVPRFLSARASAVSAAAGTTTPAAGVTVPDLKGKTLDDARTIVGGAGLNLAAGPYVNDATPRDMVAVQEPAPGTVLQAGQLVTVSLSLGPQPIQAEPTTVPVSQPAAQPPQQAPVQPKAQPPANPPGKEHKDDNKDKDKGGPKKGKDDK